jgi:hypothetical protein
VNEWVGAFLHYTSGNAIGQGQQITSNTATTITTAAFSPAPGNAGDSFSITLNPNGVIGFDAYLVGNSLYYVVSPKTTALSNTNFWWGEANLGASGSVTYVLTPNEAVHYLSLAPARYGSTTPHASITVDGNGYITIVVTTANLSLPSTANAFYADVFQCQSTVLICAADQNSGAPWYTYEYTLATTAVADLTAPSIMSLASGGTFYDALTYVDAGSAGGGAGYGPFHIFISTSTTGSLPFPAAPTCTPGSPLYHMTNWGATSSGNTVYVVGTYFGSGTYSFSCPVGGPVSAENPISGSSYVTSLGFDGSTLVAALANGNNIQTFTSSTGGTTWNTASCSQLAPCVAQNTESTAYGLNTPGVPNITPVAYTVGSLTLMGVAWTDGNVVRFGTLDLSNFPVTVNLGMTEYQTPIQFAWYPLNPANEFTITYTPCAANGCLNSPTVTVQYGSCTSTIGSCTTATPAYGCATGASAGCNIIIPNVQSYSLVTISLKSTGSTASEQYCVSISSNVGGTCQATSIGASDGIPAFNTVNGVKTQNYPVFQYFDAFSEPSYYTVQPATVTSTCPPRAPTMDLLGIATGTNTGVSNQIPSLNTNSISAANKCPGYLASPSTIYWMLKNGTDFASSSVSGASSDQWAANPANLAWTINSVNQINPNIVYYHQYINLFQIVSGGATKFDGTGSFVIYGTQYGQFKIAVATYLPSGVSSYSADLWTDAGSSVYFTPAFLAAGYRWQSCPAAICVPVLQMDANGTTTNPINTGVISNPAGYSLTYYKQFSQSLAFSVSDSSTLPFPNNPPPISYTAFGVAKNPGLNSTISTVWMDAGTTATVTGTYVGGAGERWYTPVSTWTISGPNMVTNPSIEWYHQFQQTLVYHTSDGSVVFGAPASVTITYYSLGIQASHPLSLTANVVWLDATKQAFITDPILGALSSEQWTVQPATSSWPSISATNQITDPIVYNHQYQVTFNVSPAATGSIVANGLAVPLSTPVWEPAGIAGTIPIVASPIGGYSFGGWTDTGSIIIPSPASLSTTAIITSAGTITATFTLVTGLAFVETGIALTGPLWSVTVTAPSAIPSPGSSGCTLTGVLIYTCSSNAQDIIISNAPQGSYSYSILGAEAWGAGTQYVYTGTPSPVQINAVTPSVTVTMPFMVQYYLTLASNPAGAGTVVAVPSSSAGALPGWYDAGTIPTLTATVVIPGGHFVDWTGFACAPTCAVASTLITITGPLTATANFFVPLSITLTPASESAGVGTQVTTLAMATGGSGFITLSNGPLPSDVTVTFFPNGPPSLPLNPGLPANAEGVTSTMTVTILPSAAYGVYTWTVTATDSNFLTATTTYTLDIISPSVSTIGSTSSAYAITYGSQNALFFASTHWFVIYSDGTNLIYRSSTDSSGISWNPQNTIVNGINEGYSFAVATSGSSVYLVLLSSSFTGGFYYAQGTALPGGTISWTPCTGLCALGPMAKVNTAPGLTTAGSPNVFVDASPHCSTADPSGVCVWVTVPALDSNLEWHVEVFQYTTSWAGPNPFNGGDVQLHQVYSGINSQVHSELYVMPDAVAATFAVGNTPEYPHITVFDHAYTISTTFCAVLSGSCALTPTGWLPAVKMYSQQEQGAVMPSALGTDVVFFAGLAATTGSPGANVQFYSFTYNPGSPLTSTFSAPATLLGISPILANAVINHSWHISMTFGGSNLYLAYGVDDSLAFLVGTVGPGPAYALSWSSAIGVNNVSDLVNGVTITYSGSTVGLAWVQVGGPLGYDVKFSVI